MGGGKVGAEVGLLSWLSSGSFPVFKHLMQVTFTGECSVSHCLTVSVSECETQDYETRYTGPGTCSGKREVPMVTALLREEGLGREFELLLLPWQRGESREVGETQGNDHRSY